MTGSTQRHRTHYGLAIPLATALLAALLFLVPEAWIRWLFQRDFRRPNAELDLQVPPVTTGPVRLIPAEALPRPPAKKPSADAPLRESLVARPVEQVPDATAPATAENAWTWDPTSAYSISDELTTPMAGGTAEDSTALRAALLHALRLGDLDPALAMLDTTQTARAREQFRAVDDWFFRNWSQIWKAQGAAARRAAIYERAVLEAERDKGM